MCELCPDGRAQLLRAALCLVNGPLSAVSSFSANFLQPALTPLLHSDFENSTFAPFPPTSQHRASLIRMSSYSEPFTCHHSSAPTCAFLHAPPQVLSLAFSPWSSSPVLGSWFCGQEHFWYSSYVKFVHPHRPSAPPPSRKWPDCCISKESEKTSPGFP